MARRQYSSPPRSARPRQATGPIGPRGGLAAALTQLSAEKSRLIKDVQKHGKARSAALEQADVELQRIGDLALELVEADVPIKAIANVAGISRVTLYKLLEARGYEPQ